MKRRKFLKLIGVSGAGLPFLSAFAEGDSLPSETAQAGDIVIEPTRIDDFIRVEVDCLTDAGEQQRLYFNMPARKVIKNSAIEWETPDAIIFRPEVNLTVMAVSAHVPDSIAEPLIAAGLTREDLKRPCPITPAKRYKGHEVRIQFYQSILSVG